MVAVTTTKRHVVAFLHQGWQTQRRRASKTTNRVRYVLPGGEVVSSGIVSRSFIPAICELVGLRFILCCIVIRGGGMALPPPPPAAAAAAAASTSHF